MGGGFSGEKPYEKIELPKEEVKKQPGQKEYLDKNGKLLINQTGLELVQHFESCFLKAYIDPVGVPTIAWGRIVYPDGKKVRIGDTCTQAQADEWLLEDLYLEGARFVRGMTIDSVENKLNSNQFSALVGFTYNRGAGRYRDYIAPYINTSNLDMAMDSLISINWAGSDRRYMLGLDRRRWAEKYLFEGKDWTKFKDVKWFVHFKSRGYKE